MTEDTGASGGMKGVLATAKEKLSKAAEAVTGLIKKDSADDGDGTTTAPDPSERSKKMKDAVKEARKAKED